MLHIHIFLLLLSFLATTKTIVIPCNALSFPINNSARSNVKFRLTPRTIVKATGTSDADNDVVNTATKTYEATLEADRGPQQSSRLSRLRRIFRKKGQARNSKQPYRFSYGCDELVIGQGSKSATTTAVLLIHPIGVGIGRWYYDRLLRSLHRRYSDIGHRLVFLSPDLLGSATASGPVDANGDPLLKLPLLNITDWTDQVMHLMADYEAKCETEGHAISSWNVVANGGCSPIALKVASTSLRDNSPFKATLTNVILSSPPRLPFFLEGADPAKVRKSYRTLSGVAGRLFWWYSLRKDGRFVRKFSERNLVGDAASLGEEWTPSCVAAATLNDGRSRYSTFAFLAGALQDGCSEDLSELKGSDVTIDFIRGTDKRRNRAKSWFWSRKKKRSNDGSGATTEETIQQYVHENGNGGKELYVGGRISLAWEDSRGYAKSIMELLCE